jgi:hypothetical protein
MVAIDFSLTFEIRFTTDIRAAFLIMIGVDIRVTRGIQHVHIRVACGRQSILGSCLILGLLPILGLHL